MEDKQSVLDEAIRCSSQAGSCFRSIEGRGGIWLAVELKYQQSFAGIADWTFNPTKTIWSQVSLAEAVLISGQFVDK